MFLANEWVIAEKWQTATMPLEAKQVNAIFSKANQFFPKPNNSSKIFHPKQVWLKIQPVKLLIMQGHPTSALDRVLSSGEGGCLKMCHFSWSLLLRCTITLYSVVVQQVSQWLHVRNKRFSYTQNQFLVMLNTQGRSHLYWHVKKKPQNVVKNGQKQAPKSGYS